MSDISEFESVRTRVYIKVSQKNFLEDLLNDPNDDKEMELTIIYHPQFFYYQCSDCEHIYPYGSILHNEWKGRVTDNDYCCDRCERSHTRMIYGDCD